MPAARVKAHTRKVKGKTVRVKPHSRDVVGPDAIRAMASAGRSRPGTGARANPRSNRRAAPPKPAGPEPLGKLTKTRVAALAKLTDAQLRAYSRKDLQDLLNAADDHGLARFGDRLDDILDTHEVEKKAPAKKTAKQKADDAEREYADSLKNQPKGPDRTPEQIAAIKVNAPIRGAGGFRVTDEPDGRVKVVSERRGTFYIERDGSVTKPTKAAPKQPAVSKADVDDAAEILRDIRDVEKDLANPRIYASQRKQFEKDLADLKADWDDLPPEVQAAGEKALGAKVAAEEKKKAAEDKKARAESEKRWAKEREARNRERVTAEDPDAYRMGHREVEAVLMGYGRSTPTEMKWRLRGMTDTQLRAVVQYTSTRARKATKKGALWNEVGDEAVMILDDRDRDEGRGVPLRRGKRVHGATINRSRNLNDTRTLGEELSALSKERLLDLKLYQEDQIKNPPYSLGRDWAAREKRYLSAINAALKGRR